MEKRKIFDRFAKIDFTKENLNYFYHILVLTYLYNLSDQSSRSPALPCLNPKTWTVQGLGGLDLFSRNIFALKDKTIGEDREHVGTTFHVIFRSFSSRNFFSHHSQRTCWTSSHVILLAPVSKTLWPVQTSFSRNFQLPLFSREFIRCLLVWRIFFGLLGSQKSTFFSWIHLLFVRPVWRIFVDLLGSQKSIFYIFISLIRLLFVRPVWRIFVCL